MIWITNLWSDKVAGIEPPLGIIISSPVPNVEGMVGVYVRSEKDRAALPEWWNRYFAKNREDRFRL